MTEGPLPPKVRNKLLRSADPYHLDLQGPGPFQLPLLVRLESILAEPQIEIRLETESGQEVRLRLSAEAAEALRSSLTVEKKRREGA